MNNHRVKNLRGSEFDLRLLFILLITQARAQATQNNTCALLKSFAGLWRTSNKYKLCPTKIDRSLHWALLKSGGGNRKLWDEAKLENLFFNRLTRKRSEGKKRIPKKGEKKIQDAQRPGQNGEKTFPLSSEE